MIISAMIDASKNIPTTNQHKKTWIEQNSSNSKEIALFWRWDKSAEKCIPTSVLKSGNYTTIPGWNDYVKEHHIVAKQ